MSGGGGGGDTTTVQKADPWSGVQSYLKSGYADASKLYEMGGPQYYPGQTYVGRDPLENYAQNLGLNYATESLPGQIGDLQNAQQFALSSPDVANNPYVNAMMDVNRNQVNRNFTENLMPAIGQGAVGAGQYGSSRQGVAEGIAARGTQEALANANAQTQMDAYGKGLGAQGLAMGMAPATMQAGMMPMDLISGAGAYNRGIDEQALAADMERYNYNQQLPYSNLSNYMQTLQGAPWGSTSTSSLPGSSTGAGLLGGALTGAGLASSLGGSSGGIGMSALGATGLANPYLLPLVIGGGLLGSGIF